MKYVTFIDFIQSRNACLIGIVECSYVSNISICEIDDTNCLKNFSKTVVSVSSCNSIHLHIFITTFY